MHAGTKHREFMLRTTNLYVGNLIHRFNKIFISSLKHNHTNFIVPAILFRNILDSCHNQTTGVLAKAYFPKRKSLPSAQQITARQTVLMLHARIFFCQTPQACPQSHTHPPPPPPVFSPAIALFPFPSASASQTPNTKPLLILPLSLAGFRRPPSRRPLAPDARSRSTGPAAR